MHQIQFFQPHHQNEMRRLVQEKIGLIFDLNNQYFRYKRTGLELENYFKSFFLTLNQFFGKNKLKNGQIINAMNPTQFKNVFNTLNLDASEKFIFQAFVSQLLSLQDNISFIQQSMEIIANCFSHYQNIMNFDTVMTKLSEAYKKSAAQKKSKLKLKKEDHKKQKTISKQEVICIQSDNEDDKDFSINLDEEKITDFELIFNFDD